MSISNNKYVSRLSYQLPDERIARYPLGKRDGSKLLIYNKGNIDDDRFSNIHKYLPENSMLFFNNTRVIHARLKFHKLTGAVIEIFCLNPIIPTDYQKVFSSTATCTWLCMVGNLKKWKDEVLQLELQINSEIVVLNASKKNRTSDGVIVEFTWNGEVSFAELIEQAGIIPIPPYLKRNSEQLDTERYQTVYSKYDGSVAAPTAGLHFTPEVLTKMQNKNIEEHQVTLHVGAGTFQPVKTNNVLEHEMHSEFFTVPVSIIEKLAKNTEHVVATGTTTLRCLESLYWLALSSIQGGVISTSLKQWEYNTYTTTLPANEVFYEFVKLLRSEGISNYSAHTAIMIVPGYKFRVITELITNFHQPESTLLLLVAALIGDDWQGVYNHALENNFRFLSYGDSSLLIPK